MNGSSFVTTPDAFHRIPPGIATDPMSAYYGAAGYGAVPWTCFQTSFVLDFIIDNAIHGKTMSTVRQKI